VLDFRHCALQCRARSQSRDLRAGHIILGAETGELVLDRLPALTQVIELQRQIDVAQSGEGEKRGYNNPARERGGIYRIPVSSTRTVHLNFLSHAQLCAA